MNPYPGLRPFHEDDAPYFRGRDNEIEALLNLLAERRFVIVTGRSGSGKSSLVQAGVIPILRSGLAKDLAAEWSIIIIRPSRGPLESLRKLLGSADIFSKPADLLLFARRTFHAGERLLLLVDQFEEIFDYRRKRYLLDGGNESALFVNLLLAATDQRETPVSVLLTMRSDYLGECSQFRGLPEALNRGQYLVPRLTRLNQEEAITGPAASLGATFESFLLQQLLNDSQDETDGLPVLQHVLKRLWEEKGESATITSTHYQKIGGWKEALAQDARKVLEKLPQDQLEGVKRLFQWITSTSVTGQPIRRSCRFDELPDVTGMDQQIVGTVIRRFAARNFLEISGEDDAKLALIDLTHETVIWRWPELMAWVEAEQEDASRIHFIQAAATNKQKLSGATLVDARELRNRIKLRPRWIQRYLDPSELEKLLDWIMQSAEDADKDYNKAKWNGRLLFGALFLAILVSIFCGWLGLGFYQTKRIATAQADFANRQAQLAKQLQIRAEAAEELSKAEQARLQAMEASGADRQRLEQQAAQFKNRAAQLEAAAKNSDQALSTAVAQIRALQEQLAQAQSDLGALKQQKSQGGIPNNRNDDTKREIDSLKRMQSEQQQQIGNGITLLILLVGGYAAHQIFVRPGRNGSENP